MASRSQISKPGLVTKSLMLMAFCYSSWSRLRHTPWGTDAGRRSICLRWTFKLFSQKLLGGLEDCAKLSRVRANTINPHAGLLHSSQHTLLPLLSPFLSRDTVRSVGTCCWSLTKVPQLRKKVCSSESKFILSLVIGIISLCLRGSKSSKHWQMRGKGE